MRLSPRQVTAMALDVRLVGKPCGSSLRPGIAISLLFEHRWLAKQPRISSQDMASAYSQRTSRLGPNWLSIGSHEDGLAGSAHSPWAL